MNARKVRRAELESTWAFWPAERPLTRHDMAAPPQPEEPAATPPIRGEDSKREPTHGGTTSLEDAIVAAVERLNRVTAR